MNASLDVIGIGMVTAVGLDAPSACAAMRARLDGFQETRFTGPDGEWLTGAPVPLPRGWIGEKRIAHLAAGAICETFDAVPQARGQAALILCLPEDDRPGRAVRGNGAALLRRIAEIVEIDLHARSSVIAHGRPSGHVALDQARRMIRAEEAPYVMIVGVDSYLTAQGIAHYLDRRRLLTSSNPNGFIPGEAAGALLCGPGRGGLRLFGLGLSREEASIYNHQDLPLRGEGMTAAYRAALNETGIEMNQIGYRIADLIGEQYWFKQSALASMRLLRDRHEFQDIWSPAESLGNVGAAAVPLMIGMAWMAARKGYAAGNPVIVEASNDAGACGAAVLAARTA